MNTPNSLTKTVTNTSQPSLESPLRKASFPADESVPAEVRRGRLSISGRSDDHDAVESEAEQEVHIEPGPRYNKITGGEESLHETEAARHYSSYPTDEDDDINEYGYTVPILAADEVAKAVGGEHLQPAVPTKAERRGSQYEVDLRSGDATPSSRPSSRPSSVYGLHSASHSLARFVSHHDERDSLHTPLEDVDEYEPLFPDDDDNRRPISHAERFKQRPNALKQRFPSQDIWEDSPSSHHYSAEVSTPDLPVQVEQPASKQFESPEQEAARKGEPSEEERKKLIPYEERLAKSRFAPHLRDDMPTRPGMVPRFPSSDIWEDSPESQHLVTTVSSPPADDEQEEGSADVPIRPFVPQRPAGKSRLGERASSAQVAPSIPARPSKATHATSSADSPTSPTELKKVPSIPDRPKPQIPARPAKKLSGDSLSKTVSGESAATNEQERVSPPITKTKPQVPVKPGQGSKIASLRGNFMNDLNQKLGIGPRKEKEAEPVAEEAKPLEDARKGRARGPQRRAPAKAPAASSPLGFSVFTPRALWTIDDADELNVALEEKPAPEVSKVEDAPAAVGLSSKAAEQIENSTPADTSLPPTIDTTDHANSTSQPEANDEPATLATDLGATKAGGYSDPALGTPAEEKSNPLSHVVSQEEESGLSKRTTASINEASGAELQREDTDPNMDAIPASQQTTASADEEAEPLEKVPTREPDAPRLAEGEPGKASAEEV